jgi:hypothetical protein
MKAIFMDKYTRVSLLSLVTALLSISSLLLFFSFQTSTEVSVLGVETEQEVVRGKEEVFSSEGISFIYDPDIVEVQEKGDGVLLFPKSSASFQYALVKKSTEESIQEQLGEIPLYSDLTEEKRESYDDYEVLLFSYDRPTFLNREETKEAYLTVYRSSSSSHYIEVYNFNYLRDADTDVLFVKILGSSAGASLQGDQEEQVLGSTEMDNIAKTLGSASTVRVFARNCYDVNFTTNDGMAPRSLLGKSYTICSATSGSGFVVSPHGDVMTNAHVAKPHKFDSMINGVSTTGEFETLMATELVDYLDFLLGDFVALLSQEEVETFYIFVLYELYNEGGFTMSGNSNQIYVQSDESFDIDIDTHDLVNKDNQYSSTLVGSNSINSFYHTALSVMESEEEDFEDLEEVSQSPKVEAGITDIADVAIFRFDELRRFPSLQISSHNPSQGEDVTVVGYPYLDADSMLVSQTALQGATVTSGSITNIKKNSKNTYDLIQVDASIEGGNSGGPILNSEGDVLGMTTYSALSQSGNYNLGVSSVELVAFMEAEHLTNAKNRESDMLMSATSDISKDYHSRAKGKLDELLGFEPVLASSIDPLLEIVERSIEQGNDKSPWIDLGFVDIPNWGLLSIGGGLVVIFLLLIVLVIKKVRKGKQSKFEPMFDAVEEEPTSQQVSSEPTLSATEQIAPEETLRPQAYAQPEPQAPVESVQTTAPSQQPAPQPTFQQTTPAPQPTPQQPVTQTQPPVQQPQQQVTTSQLGTPSY